MPVGKVGHVKLLGYEIRDRHVSHEILILVLGTYTQSCMKTILVILNLQHSFPVLILGIHVDEPLLCSS